MKILINLKTIRGNMQTMRWRCNNRIIEINQYCKQSYFYIYYLIFINLFIFTKVLHTLSSLDFVHAFCYCVLFTLIAACCMHVEQARCSEFCKLNLIKL